MKKDKCTVYPFMEAVKGNWRNALFVECSFCPYGKTEKCEGHMVTADAEGKLIVMAVSEFQSKTGQQVEKAECKGSIERRAFLAAFPLYLEWHTETVKTCAILQISVPDIGGPCDG